MKELGPNCVPANIVKLVRESGFGVKTPKPKTVDEPAGASEIIEDPPEPKKPRLEVEVHEDVDNSPKEANTSEEV